MKYRSARKGLGYIASRLMLATGLAVVLPLASLTYPASAQQSTPRAQLGSSFDCARDTSQIVILICNNDQLRRIDHAQIHNYYILRHVAPNQRDELRSISVSAVREIHSSCATEGTLRSDSQSCIVQHLTRLRQDWSSRISATGNRSAIEEASLDSAEILQAQEQLKSSGYIPPNAAIDGIFGTGTRAGLARLQTERGIANSGLLDASTRRALQARSGVPVQAQSRLPPCPADQSVRRDMCFGTLTFLNTDRYVGEFRDGKFHGQGAYTTASGESYVGEWMDNLRNGSGTNTFPSGERYIGQFRNGQRNGWGTNTFSNGARYVGEYQNNRGNGQGTYTYADGASYIGEFRDNQFNGQGSFFSSDGRLLQSGIWRDGELVEANNLPTPALATQGSPTRPPR